VIGVHGYWLESENIAMKICGVAVNLIAFGTAKQRTIRWCIKCECRKCDPIAAGGIVRPFTPGLSPSITRVQHRSNSSSSSSHRTLQTSLRNYAKWTTQAVDNLGQPQCILLCRIVATRLYSAFYLSTARGCFHDCTVGLPRAMMGHPVHLPLTGNGITRLVVSGCRFRLY